MANNWIRKSILLLSISFMIISLSTSQTSAVVVENIQTSNNTIDPDQAPFLGILTRHDAALYNLVAEEFANSELGASVGITSKSQIGFQTPGTTQQFIDFIESTRFDASVAWGGGPTIFNSLANRGYLKAMTDVSLKNWIEANITDSVAGATMKQYNDANEIVWTASAISSFGFTVNNVELENRGLPKPTTWEDLASPDFYTTKTQKNIGMGNALDTTSNTRIYQIILQKFGWEKGWEIIYSMGGNSRIYGGSVETRASVITGETAVAMTIDFYGLIAQQDNPNTEYIIPEKGSIVNADPVAITTNTGNQAAAEAFVKFVTSQYGQSLLLDKSINRLPARSDAFDTAIGATRDDVKEVYDKTLANQGIEFNEDLALEWLESLRYHFLATITNTYDALTEAWSDLVVSYQGGGIPLERFYQLREIYGQAPLSAEEAKEINEQILSDSTFRNEKLAEWRSAKEVILQDALDAIDDPYTLTGGQQGTGTQLQDSNVIDIPFNTQSMVIGLGIIAIITTFHHKRRRKSE